MERARRGGERLFEVLPGVLSLTPTLTGDGHRAAALLWSQGALAAESVLELYGLLPASGSVHVLVDAHREDALWVRAHETRRLPARDVRYFDRFRATTVERAVLDAAARLGEQRLRKVVHQAQFKGLIDRLTLRAILDEHPGHPGLKALGAIEPAAAKTESELENLLAAVLERVPGPPPTRQLALTLASGRRIRADAAYEDARVLVEADGRSAHARMLAFTDDKARDNDALATDWLPLRYPVEELRAAERTAAQIDSVLRRRRATR